MIFNDQRSFPDFDFLFRAGMGWIVGAAVLLLITTLIANTFGIGETALAYLSSAISFFAAFAAGILGERKQSAVRLPAALITATTLVVALLTVGFLIRGEGMDSSAILSIVSFTYVGVIAGMFMRPRKKNNGKKHRFSKLT